MRGRIVTTLLLGTAMTLTMASVAWAHTEVSPGQAAAGSIETFTVSTPNEKDVPVVKERVEVPAGFEVTEVGSQDGWQGSVKGNSVVWTGGEIPEGEEQEFDFEAQPPAQEGEFVFKAFDTYEDGSVSEWTGPEDSEAPASVVQVVAGEAHSGAAESGEHGDDHGSHGEDLPETGGLPLGAIVGLAAGMLAIGSGGLLLRKRLS